VATNYLTNQFSSLSGLASVAYGSPNYFREVQNQIFQNSITYFLDLHRPSGLIEDFFYSDELLKEYLLASLENLYDTNQEFQDFIDIYIGPLWREVFVDNLLVNFKSEYDTNSNYSLTFEKYLELGIKKTLLQYTAKEIFQEIIPPEPLSLISSGVQKSPAATGVGKSKSLDYSSDFDELLDTNEAIINDQIAAISIEIKSDPYLGVDFPKISNLLNNNPQTKIAQVKPDVIIPLKESIDLGKDFKNVEFEKGYLPPQDYFENVSYPKARDISRQLPATFKDSIRQGYVGYPTTQPLEQIYNPVGNIGAGDINLDDLTQPSFSNSVLGSLNDISSITPTDEDVYSISLIGPTINGYTSFNPQTQSNGDLISSSLLPNFNENNFDKEKGSNFFDRDLGTVF
jgi:hypothetical protein